MKKFNVVAVGRAYTDIVALVSAEFLQTYQIPLDGQRQCAISELQKIREALSSVQIIAGGPSANTVAIVSALGGNAGFFGKVYRDDAGQHFLKDLKQRKIQLCCPSYKKSPPMSGTCLVLLTDDKRSFAYNPGCADYFSATDFKKFDFSKTHFFLVEAHLLTSSIASPAIVAAMQQAQDKTAIVINLHGIMQWDNFSEIIKYIISTANIIIGNHREQRAFAQAAHVLNLTSKKQLVITTKGAEGAEISQFGHAPYFIPAVPPKIFINSIGAGDAFIAGFLLSLSTGKSIEESMHHAVLTATAILEETGARPLVHRLKNASP